MSGYEQAELAWGDRIGLCIRTLDVARKCPSCDFQLTKRLDTHVMCSHPRVVPVQCVRCAYWFALPKRLLVGPPTLLERAKAWAARVLWGQT